MTPNEGLSHRLRWAVWEHFMRNMREIDLMMGFEGRQDWSLETGEVIFRLKYGKAWRNVECLGARDPQLSGAEAFV